MGPYQDVEDFDNDTTTDSYLVYGWAAMGGNWPNVELPAKLSDIEMFVNWADYDAGSTTSNINFSIVDNAEGYEAKKTDYAMTVLPATWDFDGNGSADALTDGLMLLRYTFGIRDLRMASGAMAQNSTLSATQVVDNMHRAISVADIDGNGSTDALTDGLLLLRYLFGLRGENLISGAISSDATRTTQEQIEQYLSLYMPSELTLPVQSEQNFLVGDWKVTGAEEAAQESIGDFSNLDWYVTDFDREELSCMLDDVYTFGQDDSFSYNVGTGTYNFDFINLETNAPSYIDNVDDCNQNIFPFDGSNEMSFELNDPESTLTLFGKGAYILWPDLANGIDTIPEPYFGPDQVVYEYTKLSENEIQLYIQGVVYHARFILERVPSN